MARATLSCLRTGLLYGRGEVAADLHGVQDAGAVAAAEASGLDVRVREQALALPPEEEDPTGGRSEASLMLHHQAEDSQVAPCQAANGSEELGSRSEVERFRVQVNQRLLVKGRVPGIAA